MAAPDKESRLHKEKQANALLLPLILLSTITGLTTYLIPGHQIWQQLTWLVHGVLGIALTIQLIPYLYHHIQRTVAQRRWPLILSGTTITLVALTMIATGVQLILNGQTEQTRWVMTTHVVATLTFIGLLIAHIIYHVVTLPEKRKTAQGGAYLSTDKQATMQRGILLTALIAAGITGGAIAYPHLTPAYSDKPIVEPYQYVYGDHPFRPSQTETWHNEFVDHKLIANSDECASCHQDIAKEWQSSIHKQAASDPAYVTNVSLLANNKGIASTRYCEGCHAPVALLSGQLTEGGDHGGIENTPAHIEGISCMSCHGIQRAAHLDGVASYVFEPQSDYLFGSTDNAILQSIERYLLRQNPDQHREDMARPISSSPHMCATCHAQFMDKDMNGWGWVKMQDEYLAWSNSAYSQQHSETFANKEAVRCQDCHMPLVKGNDPSADENGMHRSHRFPGANTVVPLLTNDEEQLEITKEFLQKNKMRITIEEPRRPDATQTLLTIDESIRTNTQTPYYVYLGETVNIRTIISNIGVGHNFPGGTLDINEAWVAVNVTDISGQTLYQSGHLNPDNTVDENAHFYRSLPIDKHGNLVWKHDLFNRVGEAYKDFIPAGKSDALEYGFDVPTWVKGPITVSVTLKYRKFNERYARWALGEKYREIPVVDVARASLAIPVKVRAEIGVVN